MSALVLALAITVVGASLTAPSLALDGERAGAGGGPAGAPSRAARDRRVLAVSVDGFNQAALSRLGRDGAPTLHRLLRQGAGTRNARSQVEMTVTLPNHTSMVTGRRITAARGGHGVTWNTDVPGSTVQEAAGEGVESVFSVLAEHGETGAVFSTKSKFSLFRRSWPRGVARSVIRPDDSAGLVRPAVRDLREHDRAFTLLHLGELDEVGHARGFLTPAYLRAVRRVDAMLGDVVRALRTRPRLSDVVLVLTADHGGVAGTTSHSDPTRRANYRVPFLVWGPGVRAGDLYDLNPRRRDPRGTRPGFSGRQPVRNGEVANLALDLLGLPATRGSRWNADQSLRWR